MTTTDLQGPLLALLREIGAAERDGLEFRASSGLREMRELADAGSAIGSRSMGRRMVWVLTEAGRVMVGECV